MYAYLMLLLQLGTLYYYGNAFIFYYLSELLDDYVNNSGIAENSTAVEATRISLDILTSTYVHAAIRKSPASIGI